MIWANYTWGSPWHGDPKQNGAAIALLIYLAYFVLRGSLDNREQRARLSAVYNIFAFAAMIPLIFIIPRMTSSMHPGNGGNPGFNMYDLDNNMRKVFYPAVIGWILLGYWIASLRIRLRLAEEQIKELEYEKNN
jgi:heme exporter protein C